jgi:glycerol-3-phosphate dehydrogenase
LPGGDFAVDGFDDLVAQLRMDFPFLDEFWARRLVRAYGTQAAEILGDATTAADLGQDFGDTLSEAEVRWLIANEYAQTATDIVWRRTKLGLRLTPEQISHLDTWMAQHRHAMTKAAE